MIGQNTKLYTWVDVQDQFLAILEGNNWLEGVKVEVHRSGVYIFYQSPLSRNVITDWLIEKFPNAIESGRLLLESMGNGQRSLPIQWEEVEEDITGLPFIPTFSRPKVFDTDAIELPERPDNVKPVIIATHSFKGGVGRTLHALALASALEDRDKTSRILLIDADFEAPGITWLISDPGIAFVDVLNLIHSSADPYSVIPTIARDIDNQRFGNIYFLPAFRNDNQLRSLEIKPEHIFRFADNPFIISDFTAKLAQELNVDYVIIDLRAGISELSANWLLDPRVANIFVTTLNSQSVEGTLIVLNLLAKNQQHEQLMPKDIPAIIISQVNMDQVEPLKRIWNREGEASLGTADQNINRLRNEFSTYLFEIGFEDSDASMTISPLYDSLLALSNDWNTIQKLMKTSGLFDNIQSLASQYQIDLSEPMLPEDTLIEARRKMESTVPDLVYAERHLSPDFYKNFPIIQLANRHKTRLPNLSMIGAKGAGKTFLFRQILQSENWGVFLTKVLGKNSHGQMAEVKIKQVTIPTQIDNQAEIWIKNVKPYLEDSLDKAKNLNAWRKTWIDVMAWSYGYKVGEENIGDAFIKELEQKQKQIIFIFDGLEELFPKYFQIEQQKLALRALLSDVQAYISVTPNSPLGMIVFIRRDILDHVFKQNLAQFIDRYKDYELKWNKVEALRLVAWVLSSYEIIKFPIPIEAINDASEEKLIEALYPLWGRKLGGNNSREARSAKSILEKLSNFKQEVQARDLIRFLAEAIKQEIAGGQSSNYKDYEDRILNPKAITDALPEVGRHKIEEVKEENQGTDFYALLEKLETLGSTLKVPFESVNDLSAEDISLLIEKGVLHSHEGNYYMAELFRLGLDIQKKSKGRPKTEFS